MSFRQNINNNNNNNNFTNNNGNDTKLIQDNTNAAIRNSSSITTTTVVNNGKIPPRTSSAPASNIMKSLKEENESLKRELLKMKTELAKYVNYNGGNKSHPTTPILQRPEIKRTRSRSSPPPSKNDNSVTVKLPNLSKDVSKSSDIITDDDDEDDDILVGPGKVLHSSSVDSSDLDKHESGRGLKHRKHHNNTYNHPQLPAAAGAVNNKKYNRLRPKTPEIIDNNKLESHHHDIESAPFLIKSSNNNNGDGLLAPRTPDTVGTKTTYMPTPGSSLETEYKHVDNNTNNYEHDSDEEEEDNDSPYLEPINGATNLFWSSVQDRAGWLVGLLILQSMSSFIISRNETLLQNHLVIVRFLTMLVGAGGNAGNQASVGVIRGLAIGTVHDRNLKQTIIKEIQIGIALSIVLGAAGAIRAAIFMTPFTETLAITTSLIAIVFISVLFGAILPLIMKYFGIDPAHSSTSIQVIMDILGVTITVYVSGIILDSAFNNWINTLFR